MTVTRPQRDASVSAALDDPDGPARRGAATLDQPAAPPAGRIAGSTSRPVTSRLRRNPIRRLAVVLLAAFVVLGGGVALAYRWWYDSTYFVSTDNAQISGRLVQVGSLAAGRVSAVRYDVGDHVGRDNVVATLYAPIPVGITSGGTPRLEFLQTSDALVEVRAPVEGLVVARAANPGDTVPAGQPLLTLVDPRQLWVNANVEETQVRRVQRGQRATVHVDVLDIDLAGRVAAITPATAATFSLLPSQNLSGNFTKTTQLVPVKIELDEPDPRLMIGASVEAKIRVRD